MHPPLFVWMKPFRYLLKASRHLFLLSAGVTVAAHELIHTTGSVNQLRLTCEEGV